MSDTYTKLFSSITASTIVSEPLATRWLWVTMLAMADSSGDVHGSIPGLARIANISLEDCEAALARFLGPDPYSRTKDNEGRRVEEIDGGWKLLNHAKYRKIRSAEERRDYMRNYMRDRRAGEGEPEVASKPERKQVLAVSTEVTPPAPTPAPKKEQDQKTAPRGEDLLAGVDVQVAADFEALRTKVRAPITKTAIAGIVREASKAGLDLNAALVICCERGWRGFKAEWLHESRGQGNGTGRESVADRAARLADEGDERDRRNGILDADPSNGAAQVLGAHGGHLRPPLGERLR